MKRSALLLLAVLGVILAACSPAGSEGPSTLAVKSVVPAADATNVPVDTLVLVEFTSALDMQSLADAVALQSADGAVEGTYEFDAATNKLTFKPDQALAYGTEYTVGVSDWVRSQSGVSLAKAVAWSFTTELEPQAEDDQPETEQPGDDEPEDEAPVEEDPADETPGSEEPEDDNPGDQDPVDGAPGDQDPEDGTPGDENPGDETPGEEDPEDGTPGDQEPEEENPGDEVPEDELPDPQPGLPSPDETDVVLPGVVSVSPKPWTRASTDTTVEVVFNKEFDNSALEAGVDIKAYPLVAGFFRALFGPKVPGSISGTMIADGDTVTLSFDELLANDEWYWVFLDIDLEDGVGNQLTGSGNWLFKTLRN